MTKPGGEVIIRARSDCNCPRIPERVWLSSFPPTIQCDDQFYHRVDDPETGEILCYI